MPTYVQAGRPLTVSTPLGQDMLLLTGFSGHEAMSRLFEFQLDLIAENETDVPFQKLLGQDIVVSLDLPDGTPRQFAGICRAVAQGGRDETFTTYRMEIVPELWLLTKTARSRTFQQMSVPDILKEVLSGLIVTYELLGTYKPRDYCVQYRETDFNFAARLMEEEGIFFFFKHSESSHSMVVADSASSYPSVPTDPTLYYQQHAEGSHVEGKVGSWEKAQEILSSKFTLRDHSFEIPGNSLEATTSSMPTVEVGSVSHKLYFSSMLEIYDSPGEYAQRFDGVSPGGGDRAADVQNIFEDNARTVKLRLEEEAAGGLNVRATGDCRQVTSGHTFLLIDHFNADGLYVITSARHDASMGQGFRSGEPETMHYRSAFNCIPVALPFRPARVTAKPFVQGPQTAVVVGPAGEEIFTDKYGRVKVQFHWDRLGKKDANSSCWIRVGSAWAGKQWGFITIPRIGQEVIVDFEEGDPDRPLITGSVYNADMMPPYDLPANKTQSGIKSRSTMMGSSDDFNELRFEDKKSSEQVYFHAQKDFDRVVENNDTLTVGSSDSDTCPDGSQTSTIYKNRTTTIQTGDETTTVAKGKRTVTIQQDESLEVKQGDRSVLVDMGNDSHEIKQGNRSVVIDLGNDSLNLKMGNQTTKLDLGASSTEAMQSIELKVGQSSIKVDQTGVTISGMMVSIDGKLMTKVKGAITQINADGVLTLKGGVTMIN